MADSSTASFQQFAQAVRPQIDEALDAYSQFGDGCPETLSQAIRYSLLGAGKRLRPMLVLMAAEACGYECASAMPAACSVEMVHAYSLIHDDLPAMDDDDLRRGRPTCHKKYGEAMAILAGDALLTGAFELLATRIEPKDIAAKCCAELSYAAGAAGMVGGQADDLAAESAGGGVDKLVEIHRRKTGAMIRVSLRLGALVGGADDEQLAALDTYGERLGLAFQIVDDLLDVRGQPSTTGKRTRKDSDRGKLTYPGLLGIAESTRRAEQLVSDAHRALALFGSRSDQLAGLADYVLERNH